MTGWTPRGADITEAERVLRATRVVLVVDWPSRDVPDTLAQAGFSVIVRGGPGPGDYVAYEFEKRGDESKVRRRRIPAPERVDLVYAHRPFAELAGIVALAVSLGAATIWVQSGLTGPETKHPEGCWVAHDQSGPAQTMAEGAGLTYLERPYIADVIRQDNFHA